MISRDIKFFSNNIRFLISIMFVAAAGMLFTAVEAQAADTITAAAYLDTDNNGIVETVRFTFDENVTACAYDAGDWSVDVASDVAIVITGLTCTGADAFLDINVTSTSYVTGSTTDPVISYTNNLNRVTLTSGNAATHASVTVSDLTLPVITDLSAGTNLSPVTGVTENVISITYTEAVRVYGDGAGGAEIISGASAASNASVGAMTAARTLAGFGSWAALNGGDMTTSSATGNLVEHSSGSNVIVYMNDDATAYFNAGTTAPGAAVFTPTSDANVVADLAGNAVNAVSTYTIGGAAWNVTVPTISSTYSCDSDADGDIDKIEALFSKNMTDASILAANFEADNDTTNNATGEEVPASYSTSVSGCSIYTSATADDTHGVFTLTTGISGTQSAYLHHVTASARDTYGNRLALGSALGTENDSAAPVPLTSVVSDADADGYMDLITVTFSEVLEVAADASADWALTSASNFLELTEGTVSCNSGDADVQECRYGFTTTSVKTDVGDLSLVYTAGTSVADGSSNAAATYTYTSASTVPLADGAAPVVVNAYPLNGNNIVRISDPFQIIFSEPMVASFAEGVQYTISPDPGAFTPVWSDSNKVVQVQSGTAFACATAYTISTTEAALDAAAGTPTTLVTTGPSTGDWTFTTYCGSSGAGGGSSTPTTWTMLLNSPNGGESLVAGENVTIDWTTGGTGNSNYADLYYSLDNGQNLTLIAKYLSGNSYTWNIPANLESTSVKIVVRTTDLVTTLAEDISNSNITISKAVAVVTDPTVVTAPASGTTGKSPITGLMEEISVVNAGDYIKSPSYSTVYYIGADLKRHPFVDAQTYFTWQTSFNVVQVVTDATLSTLTLGTPMLPKYEVVLVKIQSVNKVYALEFNPDDAFAPKLRWITSEAIAKGLYGNNWADYVIDVPPTVFTRFVMGADVNSLNDLSVNLAGMKMRVNLR